MSHLMKRLTLMVIAAVFMAACASQPAALSPAGGGSGSAALQTRVYTLKTGLSTSGMSFVGVGQVIDGQTNPTLNAQVGDTVHVELINGDNIEHNIDFPDFNAESPHISTTNSRATVEFKVTTPGTFAYYCNLPGHRQAGMEGRLLVTGQAASAAEGPVSSMIMPAATGTPAPDVSAPAVGADIVHDPGDLPGPIGSRGPATVRLDLTAQEVVGQLNQGTTFTYWTFNGNVPGPFFRVRVGDTVEVHLKNSAGSHMAHSVDFHAVTGPGGGAVMTTTPPGGETSFAFKALERKYILVDHALARMERGLSGWLVVDGNPAPDIFNGTPMPGSGH